VDTPSSFSRELARRLLALEAASRSAADARLPDAVRVCEKLRISLTRFAGPEGFTSLLRRAVVLARAEVPTLQAVNVKPDGCLDGLEALSDGGSDAPVAIIANLLGLLTTFIGASLTARLVRDVWPDALLDQ
jgi:hypothetical protein